MPLLTIAIPTYNRSKYVAERLKEIIPQLVTPDVHLCVFDNASTDATRATVEGFLSEKIAYVKAAQNMGMARNICRGLEDVTSEWVWILGDDDPVTPTAVADALSMIRQTSASVIQFDSTGGMITEVAHIASLDELYQKHDPIRTLYISALLFRRASLTDLFYILPPSSFTFGPHSALIVHMLEKKTGTLELQPLSLLKPVFTGKSWSSLEVALGMSLFPEFVKDIRLQKLAAAHLQMDTAWKMVYGLREIRSAQDVSRWKRIYRQVSGNLRAYGAPFWMRATSCRKPDKGEVKDYAIMRLAALLPGFALIKMGAHVRKKHETHTRQEIVYDLNT